MRALLTLAGVLFVSVLALGASNQSSREQTPRKDAATEAFALAERDRVTDAIALLKHAIALNPADVTVHAAYIQISTFYLNNYDGVRAQYDALVVREPD